MAWVFESEMIEQPRKHILNPPTNDGGFVRILARRIIANAQIVCSDVSPLSNCSVCRLSILTREIFPGTVDGNNIRLSIQHGDMFVHRIEHGLIPLFDLAQRSFSLALCRNINGQPEYPPDTLLRVDN